MADLEANARRFGGFAELYDQVRPSPPAALAEILPRYAGMARARRVVDLGSGTGLSTRWCAGWADEVVGVEPNDAMRSRAEARDPPPNVSYQAGWAHETGQLDQSADVVVAVQALHWMDPGPTFAEVARILRPGGVFAALDCDWPPHTGHWEPEAAWQRCRALVRYYENRLTAGFTISELAADPPTAADLELPISFGRDAHKDRVMPFGGRGWSKDEHLARMKASRAFRWCSELAAQTVELGDAGRFVDLFRSQGDWRPLVDAGLSEDALELPELQAVADATIGAGPTPFWFTYRARLGIR